MFDALGRTIDGKPPLDETGMERRNIFEVRETSKSLVADPPEILETGIKVLDFFTPFVKGRKIGIIGGAGVGKTVLTMEMINNVAVGSGALSVSSPVLVSVSVKVTNSTRRSKTTTCSRPPPCSSGR